MKKCPHCGLEHIGGKSFGAYVTNCLMNPNREKILEKISNANKGVWKIFNVNCTNCGKQIEISECNTNNPKKIKAQQQYKYRALY